MAAQPVAHRLAVLNCSSRGGLLHYVFTVFTSLPHFVDHFGIAITLPVPVPVPSETLESET